MHHHFNPWIWYVNISNIIGIITVLLGIFAVLLAYRIGTKQIKLIDKQMRLWWIQLELNKTMFDIQSMEDKIKRWLETVDKYKKEGDEDIWIMFLSQVTDNQKELKTLKLKAKTEDKRYSDTLNEC